MSTPQKCPKCGEPLKEIFQPANGPYSMLNADQWRSQLAGDLFCTCHNNHRGNKPYAYFWKSEFPAQSVEVRDVGQHPLMPDDLNKMLRDCKCICHKVGLFGFLCCPCTTAAISDFAHSGGWYGFVRQPVPSVPEQRVEVGEEGRERDQRGDSVPHVRHDSRQEAGSTGVDSLGLASEKGTGSACITCGTRMESRCPWGHGQGTGSGDAPLEFIGDVRRRLFVDVDCEWNGDVRDITAKLEQPGMLVDSELVIRTLSRLYRNKARLAGLRAALSPEKSVETKEEK